MKDAKAFLSEPCEKNCPMHAEKTETALLTNDKEIDVNIVGI